MALKKKTTKKVTKVHKAKAEKKESVTRDIVITSPADPTLQLVVASELADDEMIEAELMGSVLQHFVYKFNNGDREVVNLTVAGVNETVRRLNKKRDSGTKIRVSPNHLKIERDVIYDGEKGVEVSVFAENLVDGNSAWGIKFEPYQKEVFNKSAKKMEKKTNTFAIEKALSKAERNAKRKLIPETLASKMIEKMLKENNGTNVKLLDKPTFIQKTVINTQTQKPSEAQDLKQIVLNAIEKARTIDNLMELDSRTQKSMHFDQAFKEQVSKACKDKARIIESNEQQ